MDALRRVTTEHGSVLIFDEVVSGFRHHLGGYQAICGIRPDLTTFAKAMANGYPIAALGGRADLMDRFNTRTGGDVFFFSSRRRHTRLTCDWSSDVCSSDLRGTSDSCRPRGASDARAEAVRSVPQDAPSSPRGARPCRPDARARSILPSGRFPPRSEERRVGKECISPGVA